MVHRKIIEFKFGVGINVLLLASAFAIVNNISSAICTKDTENDMKSEMDKLSKSVHDLRERVLYLENKELEEE